MKTKTVSLYVDLHPGWHERPSSETYLFAQSNPDSKTGEVVRVKITVDLPCIDVDYPHDDTANGEASPI